jgi:hypothetical protein
MGAPACSGGGRGAGNASSAPGTTPGSMPGMLGEGADSGSGIPVLPFQADPPTTYVAKVKNILVGLQLTDDEVKAVESDPTQLGALVDGWMKLPQYATKMMRFFELAFQQTQITGQDFTDQLNIGQLALDPNRGTANVTLQAVEESFARTMLQLSAAGQPFNKAMSTQTFALTTDLKVIYALLDTWEIDDNGKITDYFQKAQPANQQIVVTAQGAQIPLSDTINPKSANYMHWYDPNVASVTGGTTCKIDPITYPAKANTVYYLLHGQIPQYTVGTTKCQGYSGNAAAGAFVASDFNDWTMVSIRPPQTGEATTAFYDLPSLRNAKELVLNIPRVGFFSTPAFFANWPTNNSNQMRVTLNQVLIVATGAQVDGMDMTVPSSTPGLDAVHAAAPACVNCHQFLDPSRSILAATYSYNYHSQLDPKVTAQLGRFVFQGVDQPVKSVVDLGGVLEQHPLAAAGWTQKLCYYVNSEACASGDPEFTRLVQLFQSSNYSWDGLVKAVVTSPITTHALSTTTASTNGEVVAVSRRDHLCAAWNARLGFVDVCGLDATKSGAALAGVTQIVTGFPSDGYGRGSVAPVLPNQPSLFFRAGTENLCAVVATQVIDNSKAAAGVKTWSSSQPDAAISDFVNIVMGLTPSDPRAGSAQMLLRAHFDAARQQQGITATAALQSTFVVACGAPSALSIGM